MVCSTEELSTFRRNSMPQSSGLKGKPSPLPTTGRKLYLFLLLLSSGYPTPCSVAFASYYYRLLDIRRRVVCRLLPTTTVFWISDSVYCGVCFLLLPSSGYPTPCSVAFASYYYRLLDIRRREVWRLLPTTTVFWISDAV
jgi:hypothetical protein